MILANFGGWANFQVCIKLSVTISVRCDVPNNRVRKKELRDSVIVLRVGFYWAGGSNAQPENSWSVIAGEF
jgi:hypothetical protein